MRTIDKYFPDLFAALGITIVATWFALIVMGMTSIIANVLFLFATAFVFELYSSSQQAKMAIKEREEREKQEHIDTILRQIERDEGHAEEVQEWEEEPLGV
jgi:uncharacterized membrane protein